ncbi:MAG: phosphoglycerate kinase [Eubacteriales bacterium]|nr:phosphoglycerate kinase [Eubacteriales bacterium]
MESFNKVTIDDIDVFGKRVLLRLDLNVPIQDGSIKDKNRLITALPTINKLLNDGGKIIMCSHLGKPKGEANKKFSLEIVAKELSNLLNKKVKFLDSDIVINDDVKQQINQMQNGEICLLQNTRFRKEEELCEENFSKELASLCDIYVNDAFGTAHRAHASNVGVAKFVKENAVGYLMLDEIRFLGNAINNPNRPLVAILGGAKIEDKLNVISNLLVKCDTLIIGGGMAYTFLKAKGYEIGQSLCDNSKIQYCEEMMNKAKRLNKKLLLPIDAICANRFPNPIDENIPTKCFKANEIPSDYMGLDIGEETIKIFMKALKNAKTVVWNGPMGMFENKKFALGTYCIARTLTELKYSTTIIGGGDSASFVNNFGLSSKMTHISTGGGASLEFLEGKVMPGIDAINNK